MQKNNQNNRCVIYARYSCHNQTEQSIEGQLHDCEQFAKHHNLQIVNTYIDRALTATSDKRPAFQQMISDSNNHLFDVLLVWKLDRFSRDRYDSAVYKKRLKSNGVQVMSVMENISDTPEGVLMESLLEGFAEYFSRDLAQKVIRGMRETAKKHKITGVIPFGYTRSPENTYIPDENTAPAVRKVFEMYLAGESKTDIADYLNNHGYHTAYGNLFTKNSITPLVSNTRYIGKYTYDDLELFDENQRIVSDEIFERVQLQVKSNQRTGAMHRAKERYLLTGKLHCGYCKQKIHGESGTSRNNNLHFYYVCNGRKKLHTCNHKRIRKDCLEKCVLDNIMQMLKNKSLIQKIANVISERQNTENSHSETILNLEKQLSDVTKKINNLISAIENGITSQSTQLRLNELEELKSNLEYELTCKRNQNSSFNKPQIINFFRSLNLNTDATWQEQKIIIQHLVDEIYLWNDKILIIYNFTSHVKPKYNNSDIDSLIKMVTENCSVTKDCGKAERFRCTNQAPSFTPFSDFPENRQKPCQSIILNK